MFFTLPGVQEPLPHGRGRFVEHREQAGLAVGGDDVQILQRFLQESTY